MPFIHKPKPWDKTVAVDQGTYWNRRRIIKSLGLATGSLMMSPIVSCAKSKSTEEIQTDNSFTFEGIEDYFPGDINTKYKLDRELTDKYTATHNNNFYEFIDPSDPNIYNAYKFVGPFENRDWKFTVEGLANNTGTFLLEDIIKRFGQEERTYRFRCVERWSMAVPWNGISLAKLIRYFEPKNEATHVRMVSYADADQMTGVKNQPWYPWPYYEGLRMDEAMNELSFMATGIFGEPLPKQNGAPMRLIVPWKYGYKNIKSIVRIEFVKSEPGTFWNKLNPDEYGFYSNIDPLVPHPRWSQERERMIPDGDWRPTLPYNGYGELVASMYK